MGVFGEVQDMHPLSNTTILSPKAQGYENEKADQRGCGFRRNHGCVTIHAANSDVRKTQFTRANHLSSEESWTYP